MITKFTILLNERDKRKFVIPSDIDSLPIYDWYQRLGYVEADSLINAYYMVNT